MKKSTLSIAAAAMLMASAGLAFAQSTTTTTTWTNDQGQMIRQYSTSKNYSSFTDPNFQPTVGAELPGTVTLYNLPDGMKVATPDRYRYAIVNNTPVIVDSTSHKVVHSWADPGVGGDGTTGR